MTDEDRKFLTEAMGSKWIEPYFEDYADYGKGRTSLRVVDRNHTFTTWADFGAVWEWAQKQEWWVTFHAWMVFHRMPRDTTAGIGAISFVVDPARFPQLIADFLRQQEVPK